MAACLWARCGSTVPVVSASGAVAPVLHCAALLRNHVRDTCRYGASTRGDFATTSLAGDNRLDPGRRRKAFRLDCTKVWGNAYDYSQAKYKDNHTPLEVVCPKHGPFRIRPRDHIQRRIGCSRCIGANGRGTLATSSAKGPLVATPPLGQHLLRDRGLLQEIAEAALLDAEKSSGSVAVAEIGVGAGALTAALLARPRCHRVIGFEIDGDMVQRVLRSGALKLKGITARLLPAAAAKWARSDWHPFLESIDAPCTVLHGDFLTCASVPGECSVAVGNIPYRISSALVLRLLAQSPPLERIVLLVQAEFARRLLARPGSMKYGRLSVICGLLCSSREHAVPGRVLPEAFSPAPRVDSAVVSLVPRRDGMRHRGVTVSVWALDRLLRVLLDGSRGQARGLHTEMVLEAHETALCLPTGWRNAVARAGLGTRAVVSLEPEDFVALTAELTGLGWEEQNDEEENEEIDDVEDAGSDSVREACGRGEI